MKNAGNVLNDLVGYKNLKILQCPDYFSFSLESVLLPNFVTIKPNIKNIIDLGCGNCPIPLILSTKTDSHIYGVEIQKEIFDLALETIKINNLESRITLIREDIKNLKCIFNSEFFDIVTVNPPYFKLNPLSKLNENIIKTNARHESLITLDEIIENSSYLLKNKGRFALVHRTERLSEIIILLKKYNLEPKRIKFIYPKKGENSNLVMIESIKNGNPGLNVLKPLVVHDKLGNYTKEVLNFFE